MAGLGCPPRTWIAVRGGLEIAIQSGLDIERLADTAGVHNQEIIGELAEGICRDHLQRMPTQIHHGRTDRRGERIIRDEVEKPQTCGRMNQFDVDLNGGDRIQVRSLR